MNRRVVVTGLGVLSALGDGADVFWEGLLRGETAIRPLPPETASASKIHSAAMVPNYDPLIHFERKHSEQMDRFAQFALIAARQALKDAHWEPKPCEPERIGVITGNCCGGQYATDRAHQSYYEHDGRPSVYTVARCMGSAGASFIAMEFGITGPSFTITTACASSSHAIGQAFWMVRSGLLDAAVTGGSEASLTAVNLKAWEVMRVVSPDICRPFSADRTGMSLGEGAAILTLEPLERAQARGATIYGEIVGFGMSSDAHHLTQPSESGMARAMQSALTDACLDPTQIGHLNAHGTATRLNDLTESRAAQIVFGSHLSQVAVSATKSVHGHTLGAAGSLEAVATILALRNGLLPPTINYTTPDPECPLDIVANQPRAAEVEYALSNSFAFGGLNASLAFCRL